LKLFYFIKSNECEITKSQLLKSNIVMVTCVYGLVGSRQMMVNLTTTIRPYYLLVYSLEAFEIN